MEFEDIERILELVRQHDLAEFELERGGLKIRVRKASAAYPMPPALPPAAAAAPQIADIAPPRPPPARPYTADSQHRPPPPASRSRPGRRGCRERGGRSRRRQVSHRGDV